MQIDELRAEVAAARDEAAAADMHAAEARAYMQAAEVRVFTITTERPPES
jgi:hypothetical protein